MLVVSFGWKIVEFMRKYLNILFHNLNLCTVVWVLKKLFIHRISRYKPMWYSKTIMIIKICTSYILWGLYMLKMLENNAIISLSIFIDFQWTFLGKVCCYMEIILKQLKITEISTSFFPFWSHSQYFAQIFNVTCNVRKEVEKLFQIDVFCMTRCCSV